MPEMIRAPSGVAQAMRYYRRLCPDEQAFQRNGASDHGLIRDVLYEAPSLQMVMDVLTTVEVPVSRLYLHRALRTVQPPLSEAAVGMVLWQLVRYELVRSVEVATGRVGPRKRLYALSPLGQLVVQASARRGNA